jgi:hypothetical protein
MSGLDLDILHLFKLLGSSDNQFFLIFYYIADVVGSFSGTVGDKLTLFKHGYFQPGIASFCSCRRAWTGGGSTDDQEFFFLCHTFISFSVQFLFLDAFWQSPHIPKT